VIVPDPVLVPALARVLVIAIVTVPGLVLVLGPPAVAEVHPTIKTITIKMMVARTMVTTAAPRPLVAVVVTTAMTEMALTE